MSTVITTTWMRQKVARKWTWTWTLNPEHLSMIIIMENLERKNGLRIHCIPSPYHNIVLKRSHSHWHGVFTVHCFTLDFLRHWLQLTGSNPFLLLSLSYLNSPPLSSLLLLCFFGNRAFVGFFSLHPLPRFRFIFFLILLASLWFSFYFIFFYFFCSLLN